MYRLLVYVTASIEAFAVVVAFIIALAAVIALGIVCLLPYRVYKHLSRRQKRAPAPVVLMHEHQMHIHLN